MVKKKNQANQKPKLEFTNIIAGLLFILVGFLGGYTLEVNIRPTETLKEYVDNITLSSNEIEAYIEDDQGEVEIVEGIPTLEEVDGGEFDEAEGEGVYDDQGEIEAVDVSSPSAFMNSTLGRCIYANNKYGAQCVSLARVFWNEYAGFDVSTCGTGSAKGMMICAEQNAGDKFEIIYESSQIQNGTWVVFSGGIHGHVGMALGPAHDGYVTILGENQGGALCAGGGRATNIINLSLKNFLGGYTPISYISKEEESRESEEIKSDETKDIIPYTYKKGDYFSKVLVELGLDEGNLWGENGTVKYYTQQLIDQGMLEHGNTGNVIVGREFTLTRR